MLFIILLLLILAHPSVDNDESGRTSRVGVGEGVGGSKRRAPHPQRLAAAVAETEKNTRGTRRLGHSHSRRRALPRATSGAIMASIPPQQPFIFLLVLLLLVGKSFTTFSLSHQSLTPLDARLQSSPSSGVLINRHKIIRNLWWKCEPLLLLGNHSTSAAQLNSLSGCFFFLIKNRWIQPLSISKVKWDEMKGRTGGGSDYCDIICLKINSCISSTKKLLLPLLAVIVFIFSLSPVCRRDRQADEAVLHTLRGTELDSTRLQTDEHRNKIFKKRKGGLSVVREGLFFRHWLTFITPTRTHAHASTSP